jgi:alpha-D-xyloside xylohydrolase
VALEFPNDTATHDLMDEYLFGQALLVCPVTKPMYYDAQSKPICDAAKCRSVYLPAGTAWVDFWTDRVHEGGQAITADAPLEIMPLFVRAGSILPMTEPMQFVDEHPAAPYEIRVYQGADGAFTIYEDAGDGYDYERGAFALVKLSWNDRLGELSIGERKGRFPGLATQREYRLVFISARGRETRTLNYDGRAKTISITGQ